VSLRDELVEFLVEQRVGVPRDLDDATSLIESGLLDSLALFNLTFWIEERVGVPLDPTSIDVAREWNSVRDILAFLNARCRAAG
jgi:acyl carrier protein